MDITSALLTLLGIGAVGWIIYLANGATASDRPSSIDLRWPLYGVVGAILLLSLPLFQIAFSGGDLSGIFDNVDPATALITFFVISVICVFCLRVVASAATRRRVKVVLTRLHQDISYNPESQLHTTAIVLPLMLLAYTLLEFVLGGGLSGLAENLDDSGIALAEPVFGAVLQIGMALLGVGLLIRRTPAVALSRLGLRAPTSEDFRVGFATGAGLIVVLMAFGIILVFLFTPEQLEEQNQASQQLALSFTTLPAALLVSISAAVSEEILFRGALQPVFGLLPTSVFFTLLHVQNLLTPGMVMIFVVSWVFGWVRRRYSTTAAIVAHFVYDFIQLTFLALSVSASVI